MVEAEATTTTATIILDESQLGNKPNPEPKYYYYLKVRGKNGEADYWDFITYDGPELIAVTKQQFKNWKQGHIIRTEEPL